MQKQFITLFLFVLLLFTSVASADSSSTTTNIPTGTIGGSSAKEEPAAETKPDNRPYVLRKARWGDSKAQIINNEGEPYFEDTMSNVDATYIVYETQVVGLDALLAYYFCDDGLYQIRYLLREEHSNDDLYIEDYEKFNDALKKKYGEPVFDSVSWKDDSMKEYYTENGKSMGDALCYGYCEYTTWYVQDGFLIYMNMSADNYEISTTIEYESLTISPGEADYSDEI